MLKVVSELAQVCARVKRGTGQEVRRGHGRTAAQSGLHRRCDSRLGPDDGPLVPGRALDCPFFSLCTCPCRLTPGVVLRILRKRCDTDRRLNCMTPCRGREACTNSKIDSETLLQGVGLHTGRSRGIRRQREPIPPTDGNFWLVMAKQGFGAKKPKISGRS